MKARMGVGGLSHIVGLRVVSSPSSYYLLGIATTMSHTQSNDRDLHAKCFACGEFGHISYACNASATARAVYAQQRRDEKKLQHQQKKSRYTYQAPAAPESPDQRPPETVVHYRADVYAGLRAARTPSQQYCYSCGGAGHLGDVGVACVFRPTCGSQE
jgi:Zinc knuckle